MKLIAGLLLAGALYNGKDLSGWKLRDEKADATWKIVSSVKLDPANPKKLVGEGSEGILLRIPAEKATDVVSEKSFGDCEVHLEFFLAKESNSGVFLMGQYEVQITDSFGIRDNIMHAGGWGGSTWLKAAE